MFDAFNLDETPNTEAEVGARRDHRFHTSAIENFHRLSRDHRQDDGTKGCVARSRVRDPDDSIFHQSRRKEPQREKARRAGAGEADSPAPSGEARGRWKTSSRRNSISFASSVSRSAAASGSVSKMFTMVTSHPVGLPTFANPWSTRRREYERPNVSRGRRPPRFAQSLQYLLVLGVSRADYGSVGGNSCAPP